MRKAKPPSPHTHVRRRPFPLLALPAEVRCMIWDAALAWSAPSVVAVSCSKGAGTSRLRFRDLQDPAIPPVASTCKESYEEWIRACHRLPEGRPGSPLYLPRAVLLLDRMTLAQGDAADLLLVNGGLESWRIRYIAFALQPGLDLLMAFAALSTLPALQTIIVIVPDFLDSFDADGEETCSAGLVREISRSITEPQADKLWDRTSYVGLLLRGRPPSEKVRRYYTREDSPRIQLLMQKTVGSNVETADEWIHTGSAAISLY